MVRSIRSVLNRLVAVVAVIAVVGYGAIVWWFSAHERDLIFLPDHEIRTLADSLGLHPQQVGIPSSDGTRLVGRIYRGPLPDSLAIWVLYCHGNAGNVTSRARFHQSLVALGVSVLAAEYRGYGSSEGSPNEEGINRDVGQFYKFARDSLRVAAANIVIYGFSLGTGPATELASRVPAGGLVLEAPFTSLPERGQELYPFLPVLWMAKTKFASIDKIDRVTCPKLIIHSAGDRTIPIAHGRRLFERATSPKMFLEVRGDHDNAYMVDRHIFFGGLKTFLAQVALSSAQTLRYADAHGVMSPPMHGD
jgi:fermentation-respiration switch protein FrsA (DUF1100 family)